MYTLGLCQPAKVHLHAILEVLELFCENHGCVEQ